MLCSLIAYSQFTPIAPDAKNDTAYCFGPTKTAHLIAIQYRAFMDDSSAAINDTLNGVYFETLVFNEGINNNLEKQINYLQQQLHEEQLKTNARDQQLKLANGLLGSRRKQTAGLWTGLAISVLGNIILGTLRAIHK